MKSAHLHTGEAGEKKAVDYLNAKGYRVMETNWKTQGGEIDIIAWDGETLVFAEVKTRSTAAFGWPEESVSAAKANRIGFAAEVYMDERNLDTEIRFDIISIIEQPDKTEIYHIRDAFVPEGE